MRHVEGRTAVYVEAVGNTTPGEGWRLAAKKIWQRGKIPISYQASEIVLQLTERAGKNQIKNPKISLLQSVGGPASTVITHVLVRIN